MSKLPHVRLSQLYNIIKGAYPNSQAIKEAKWIQKELPSEKWINAANQRSQHVPLQYILGNQPFGPLTLNCQKGVLIPRADTEDWTTEFCNIINKHEISVNGILDYCTGSGCISLLIASELERVTKIVGIDISELAINLSNKNLDINRFILKNDIDVKFEMGDLKNQFMPQDHFDILLSNPPYIPKEHMNTLNGVEKSVLKHEPKLALIGDLEFYQYLSSLLIKNKKFKGFIFELGYLKQARLTRKLLSKDWKVGIRMDSGNHIRNVIGWQDDKYQCLSEMCNEMI